MRIQVISTFLPHSFPPTVRRCRYRSSASAGLIQSDAELRDLYTISLPPDPKQAKTVALKYVSTLSKYLETRPVPKHTQQAFKTVMRWRARNAKQAPLCIDAGCGSGRSTKHLAKLLPHCDVIGVDKSEARLAQTEAFRRFGGRPEGLENALLVRANLIDFWRLCLEHRVFPEYQFILYPNPYPSTKNMKRRWHGHAIFPVIVALGGRVEVRANWEAYLQEFDQAFKVVHETDAVRRLRGSRHELIQRPVQQLDNIRIDGQSLRNRPLSNFEAKYVQTGLPVYQLCLDTRDENARTECKL